LHLRLPVAADLRLLIVAARVVLGGLLVGLAPA
jgi:hypothetical protein